MINVEVGDVVVIKSREHWSDDFEEVDEKLFLAGFVKSDLPGQGMEEYIGKVGLVVTINDYGDYIEVNVDFTFTDSENNFVWDQHSIEKVLPKEEYPEYYL